MKPAKRDILGGSKRKIEREGVYLEFNLYGLLSEPLRFSIIIPVYWNGSLWRTK